MQINLVGKVRPVAFIRMIQMHRVIFNRKLHYQGLRKIR